ncbi:hypothetical protein [Peribacillus sp. Bi134]|uniref:hypothetical protein n=1 Tax=Peribacillus sp. Bi134 TaxID=2884272 RepID=UPI001DBD9930|nr:hypothetical protein [Peribacillus sp. Bi134]CAH0298947.1 hypothetical protein SRABI134_04578 [Peribacillus sp. Bi134]
MEKAKFSFELDGTPYQIEYEIGPSIDWMNRRYFPKDKHGVYVAYNDSNEVIYVGKTWNKVGFFGRLSSAHHYFDTFKKECERIEFFYLEKSLDILMLERAKILQFDPPLNRDDDDRIKISEEFVKAVNDQHALLEFYALYDQAIFDEMEKRNLTEEQMIKLFNKKYSLIKKEVSIESILYETQPDYFPAEYFCFKCMDTGEGENNLGETVFCDCEIGDNLCFELTGKHIAE